MPQQKHREPSGAEQYMTVAEAQEYLGVSNKKMSRLLQPGKDGSPAALTATPDPLDRRVKLVQRSDVEALKARSVKSAA